MPALLSCYVILYGCVMSTAASIIFKARQQEGLSNSESWKIHGRMFRWHVKAQKSYGRTEDPSHKTHDTQNWTAL